MAQKVVSMQVKLAAVFAREVEHGAVVPVAVVCRRLGISRQTYYKYRRRFESEGLDGLRDRSRRPRSSPSRTTAAAEDAVVAARKALEEEGWDNGAISIHARLLHAAQCGELACFPPSLRSIYRTLHRRGLVDPQPHKRPRASYRRFEFPATDDCWQLDAWEHRLADGTPVAVFELIDDHSRFLVGTLAWPVENGAGAWVALTEAMRTYGTPLMLLSDNSLAFSGARRGRLVQFEKNLHEAGIKPITARPYKPTTCGKNERHHQTCQRWLARQPLAATLAELQAQLRAYQRAYNYDRPHQGIGMQTPAQRRASGRRSGHSPVPAEQPRTVITDHLLDRRGNFRLLGTRIGIGVHWAGCPVTVFVTGYHILVFHSDDLLRELTIDPTREHHPSGRLRGGTRQTRVADRAPAAMPKPQPAV